MRVPNLPPVAAVAGSLFYTIALCTDGTVWSWGYNEYGALGTGPGTVGTTAYTPQQIPPATLSNIRAIAVSSNFCLALDANGRMWSWGHDSHGELGLGLPYNGMNGTDRPTPVQLPLGNVRQIDVSDTRAVALRTDGTVWMWGENAAGHLGLGLNNTAYVNTPAQVGVGLLTDVIGVATNGNATLAVRPPGTTYVWGDNYNGCLAQTSPSFAYSPIVGPTFSPGVQIDGQTYLFTTIERTGTVKTWGFYGPLGYTPAAPTSPGGGSYTPTTPTGICPAVPAEEFPVCGLLRAYYQRSGATYVASLHGNTGPADLGTYGTTTVIDASQPPYNGTVVFDGEYHVRGNVQFIGGTFSLLYNTKFYIDGNNGQASRQTTLDVANATLQLHGATLQASCPERWGGVYLTGYGKLYTEAGGIGKRTLRAVIRDAQTGVYCYTPDWHQANTNEYYLLNTDFINNNTGLYDLVKATAKPGEGIRSCLFQDGYIGIQFDPVDYSPTTLFGGNYNDAAFDANTFKNLQYGMVGSAGQLHVTNKACADYLAKFACSCAR